MPTLLRRALLALALIAAPHLAFAHEGHDHGEETPAATGPGTPMLEAVGTDLELVAEARGGHLIIYVDRFITNAPVTDGQVEVSRAGQPGERAEPQPDGTYLLEAPWSAEAGSYDLTFTVTAADVADLLIGTLVVPEVAGEEAHGHGLPWAWIAGAFVLGILAAGVAMALAGRRRAGGAMAALLLLAGVTALPQDARAHAGHDHGAEETGVMPDAPRREPDGTLFVPKRTQRLLEVRTAQTEEGEAPRTARLVGRVVADPNRSGRVQASQTGRVEAPPGGLPYVGQAVEAGQTLAFVSPAIDSVERGSVREQQANIEKELVVARQRLDRFTRLKGTVAQREIDEARALLEGLERQRAALSPTLGQREALVAPVSGIVAESRAVPGQVIDDRDEAVLFEIVDPAALLVEAVAFEPKALGGAEATAVTDAGVTLKLTALGQGPARKEGAVPLLFRVEGEGQQAVPVGTPVRVHVRQGETAKGIILPRASVVTGADGLPMVWAHVSPLRFAPRPVRFEALGADQVLVTTGLEPGLRIVVQGAALLNQVR